MIVVPGACRALTELTQGWIKRIATGYRAIVEVRPDSDANATGLCASVPVKGDEIVHSLIVQHFTGEFLAFGIEADGKLNSRLCT